MPHPSSSAERGSLAPCETGAREALRPRLLLEATDEDWVRLGLGPLAWWLVRQGLVHRDLSPEVVASAFEALATWELQSGAAVALCRALEAAGVPAAFLKGTDLNLRCYPRAGLRPMLDVDLLVRAEDLGRVREVLGELEFRSLDRPEDPPANTAFEWLFVRDRDHVQLDVHTAVDWQEGLGVETKDLLRRRVRAGASGLPVLDGPDLVLNLATHALRDLALDGTRAVVDTHLALAALEPDWDALVERARAWRARPALLLLLSRLRRFEGVPVPRRVLEALQVGWVPSALAAWGGSVVDPPRLLRVRWVARGARLLAIESPLDRVRLALRYLGLRASPRRRRRPGARRLGPQRAERADGSAPSPDTSHRQGR
ncbi:MAG: nucleotidyltransferase family protein [Planctomycetota bacterium]